MSSGAEFARPVPLDQIAERVRVVEISASEGERRALAERFGLVALKRLEARIRLSRSGVFYRVEADWKADVVQTCVVTLEPLESHLADHLVEQYGPTDRQEAEVDLDLETDDVEEIEGGAIDVGEAVAQALSLTLDPYPRKPGVTAAIPGEKEGREGPFAALSRLKKEP